MELLTKLMRTQLSVVNKLADGCSVKISRSTQDKLGKLMANGYKDEVTYRAADSDKFTAEFITPNNHTQSGIILYLHGGGYVSGGIEYAKGFGTILAAQNNISVLCVAYRLAPENKFPAALNDAFAAYCYLLENEYPAENIILCGESAGGGLVYALALKLRDCSIKLPCGIIAISPWTDLTSSGPSYKYNLELDPSMTQKRLHFYAECYTYHPEVPYVSPLFGEFDGFPPSLIFAGGHEIMLSDSEVLYEKLLSAGCSAYLRIAPELWHIYLLYGIKEAKEDYQRISAFIKEVSSNG